MIIYRHDTFLFVCDRLSSRHLLQFDQKSMSLFMESIYMDMATRLKDFSHYVNSVSSIPDNVKDNLNHYGQSERKSRNNKTANRFCRTNVTANGFSKNVFLCMLIFFRCGSYLLSYIMIPLYFP